MQAIYFSDSFILQTMNYSIELQVKHGTYWLLCQFSVGLLLHR